MELDETAKEFAAQGNKIEAIKHHREVYNLGLLQAKRDVESYLDSRNETEIWVLLNEADTTLDLETKVECLLQAVKLVVK